MTVLTELVDYRYAPSAPCLFDCYRPNGVPHALLVYVHGGAWRTEDKRDHAALARRLALATDSVVLVPNYSLSSSAEDNNVRHPAHAEDILRFLHFLLTDDQWKASATALPMYLIGHSCSAHMLASIFLDSDAATPSLRPSPQLLRAVAGIILSEGIYDIDALLHRFPDYAAWFINDAFGSPGPYPQFSTAYYKLRTSPSDSPPPIAWLLMHSRFDTLVNIEQTEAMYNHLCSLYGDKAPTFVSLNTHQLKDAHDDIFRGDEYFDIVSTFLSRPNVV